MAEGKQLKFFFETRIPPDATDELRRQEVDLIQSLAVGFPMDEADIVLLEYSTQEKRLLVTCDDDFLHLDAQWREQ